MFGVKVEAASKEAPGVLASDSVVFKHNTLPQCFQETEQPNESDVYFMRKKYAVRLLGYAYEGCVSVVYTFLRALSLLTVPLISI